MYNTVTTFRCHITRRHGNYLESSSTAAANTPPTDDTPMDIDDNVDENSREADTDDGTNVNSLLDNFAKHLAFLRLKVMEEKHVASCSFNFYT